MPQSVSPGTTVYRSGASGLIVRGALGACAEGPGKQESERYDRLTDLLDHGDPSLLRFLDRLEIEFSTPM